MTTSAYDAIIIGAGVAGLSAGVRLARDGARVLVLEARSRLGGRATAFIDRHTGELVDNGQHILLGCYTDTRAFLQDIGASDRVRFQPTLGATIVDETGRRSRFECPPLPSPLHLVAGIFDWEALAWRDRLAILRMAAPLRVAQRALAGQTTAIAASPGETVDQWLTHHRQTKRLRTLLWDPLALAALNQPPDQAAAPPFARVLAEMFGADPRAASIGLPSVPLTEMYADPAREYIERRGGRVATGVKATVHVSGRRGDPEVIGVTSGSESWTAAVVISSVPWFAMGDLFSGDTDALDDLLQRSRRTVSAPIVTVNLWFDKPVLDEPFIGLPGRTMQWVFGRGTRRGEPSSAVSLVVSGAHTVLRRENDDLIATAHAELSEALPGARTASLVHALVIREPHATFSLAPGQPQRPSTETGVRGLLLAGDWIDTGLPATIESAARSGHRAAQLAVGLT